MWTLTLYTMQLMTPEYMAATRYEREIDERNRPLSDEELDAMFPQEGYTILAPPPGYQPIRTPSRKLTGTSAGPFMCSRRNGPSALPATMMLVF
jgi:splicing factor 3B subunit 1